MRVEFLPRWSRAKRERAENGRSGLEGGLGVSRPREKSTGEEKKNRRSVGKRNYRLMRRSFRHVGSERESAIGRCFLAEVIRVFARSLPFVLFSLALLCPHQRYRLSPRLRGGHTRAFMIYPPPDVYWKHVRPLPPDRVRIR